jgi:cytochrome c oxidase assembly protein subunit 11
MSAPTASQRASRRTAVKLGAVAAAMFLFGYALVPLYDVICQVTGLNGKTAGRAEAASGGIDRSRTVTVEFVGQVQTGLPWEFRPMVNSIDVHPGETTTVKYYARNRADESIVGQAVPSVAPGLAAAQFKKIECFCFTQQELKAGEGREMAVQFVVDPKLAPEVQTVTLSYSFFNADRVSAQKYGARPGEITEHAAHDHSRHAGG